MTFNRTAEKKKLKIFYNKTKCWVKVNLMRQINFKVVYKVLSVVSMFINELLFDCIISIETYVSLFWTKKHTYRLKTLFKVSSLVLKLFKVVKNISSND